jgi:hypothetical protein
MPARLLLAAALLLSLGSDATAAPGGSFWSRLKQAITPAVHVTLRAGGDTVQAYRQARASGVTTVIKMDFGSLRVAPGQLPTFDITKGVFRDVPNAVRRAHNLAYDIGAVVVTQGHRVIGRATSDSASEKPLLNKLAGGLR